MRLLQDNFEKILATLASDLDRAGETTALAVLATSKTTLEESEYDNWNGGMYGYTLTLLVPDSLYQEIESPDKLEESLLNRLMGLTRPYENEYVKFVSLIRELSDAGNWREKTLATLTGQGLTNQGRARSDNVAPIMVDGLYFRSQPEVNLYRALKSLGVAFAPLAVFIRGGETYQRIEPDFVILRDGLFMVVEVDGDTIHRETPVDAHSRLAMLGHEGAIVERVSAKECDTPEKAKVCAARLLGVLKKIKATR